jgi:HlyD family secretion protein
MKKKNGSARRWAAWAAMAALALAAAAWAFWPRALEVEVGAVATGRFEQTIQEDGRMRVVQRYVVSAPTQAELERPALKVGDAVAAGDVVASLVPAAPQMIDARTRGVLRERVGSADAALAAASAQVGRAEAALAQARLEAERATQLARDNFISASARDQARLALAAQQKTLDAAEAQVHVSKHAAGEARAALARSEGGSGAAARGRWQLRAPVAGRVTKLHHESATTVAPGAPLIEIADTARLEAVIDVLSSDALRIPPGAAVRLAPGGGLAEVAAHVVRIEPVAFTKVSALGIEEQRVNVIAHADAGSAAPAALGDGFRIDATISLGAHDGVLLAPTAALVRDGTRWSVLVVADGRARRKHVEIVERNPQHAWVRNGVQAGETVVLYPGAGIGDGQRVRVRR